MSMDDQQRRQVLPDVDEGAEIGGYSITSLLRLYVPAFSIMFYGINLAPAGWGGPLFLIGLLAALVTTVIIIAAPSGEPPSEYARNLYRQHTKQGIKIHE